MSQTQDSGEPIWVGFLRDLDGHSEGRTCTDLAYLVSGPAMQGRQSRAAFQMRKLVERGYVSKDGQRYIKRAEKAKEQPSIVWKITDDGRRAVFEYDQARIREVEARAASAEHQALAAELSTRRNAALINAAGSYSRSTPPDVRRKVAAELRDLGCSLEIIGKIFGVTREMIRRDLQPHERDRKYTRHADLVICPTCSSRVAPSRLQA